LHETSEGARLEDKNREDCELYHVNEMVYVGRGWDRRERNSFGKSRAIFFNRKNSVF
jgi:hypothetical protein